MTPAASSAAAAASSSSAASHFWFPIDNSQRDIAISGVLYKDIPIIKDTIIYIFRCAER